MAASDPPTAKQLRYLRALAEHTGTTSRPPTTRRQASEAIDQLLPPRVETARRAPRQQPPSVSDDLAPSGLGQRVRPDEIAGYGSQRPLALMGVRPPPR